MRGCDRDELQQSLRIQLRPIRKGVVGGRILEEGAV